MASTIRVHNGKGARRAGTPTKSANEGHAADSHGFYAGPLGYVVMTVGETVCASTKAQKRAVNQGLHAAGWIGSAYHNMREHPNGAVIEISRDGRTATYTRTS